MKDDQKIGYHFEVDLKCSEELHDKHSDLPYCPENVISDSQLPKLFTTLYDKKNYFDWFRDRSKGCRFSPLTPNEVIAGLSLTKVT